MALHPTFPRAIGRLRPGEPFSIVDDAVVFINAGVTTPTPGEIDAMIATIAAEDEASIQRDAALLADTDRQNVLNAIRTATPAQIKNFVNNNVTDLASARQMLTRIMLLIAMVVRR